MASPGSLLRPACERREGAAREAGDVPARRPARLAFRTCLAVAPRRIVLEGEIGNHAYRKVTVAPPSRTAADRKRRAGQGGMLITTLFEDG